ncbi:MAG: putative toxin-antitoxin system toxin component, PIN family [Armatimonadota bacterium]
MRDPPVVVFDCNTFLQGLINVRGPAGACIRLFQTGEISLVLSSATLSELRDVLSRPELRRKFQQLTPERVEALLELIAENAILITDVPHQVALPRDPKDEAYLDLALAAKADYLVTRDNDLLHLMDAERDEGREFRARFPTLTILDPVAFLQVHTADSPDRPSQ